jgi:hypothetical protein
MEETTMFRGNHYEDASVLNIDLAPSRASYKGTHNDKEMEDEMRDEFPPQAQMKESFDRNAQSERNKKRSIHKKLHSHDLDYGNTFQPASYDASPERKIASLLYPAPNINSELNLKTSRDENPQLMLKIEEAEVKAVEKTEEQLEMERKRERIFKRFQEEEERNKNKPHEVEEDSSVKQILVKRFNTSYQKGVPPTKSLKIINMAKLLEQHLNQDETSQDLRQNEVEDTVTKILIEKPILKKHKSQRIQKKLNFK